MRKLCVCLLVLSSVLVFGQVDKSLEVKEFRLGNGMKVWLNEDHTQPKVFGAVVVNAGAKDCPNTGIAHYFEHILFKGTEDIGTIDYTAEKPWLDSISAKYDQLARTTDASARNLIQKDISRLSQKAGEYAIPNEFNRLISRYGGTELNAGTSWDFTYYHNVFTPQFMEQWCQLNSDRLINPVFRLFQGELETVYEEKNMYSDNMMSTALEKVLGEMFGDRPYAYPVIGSTENLKNPKQSDMKAFYEKYYVASNMGLVLCGDFDASSIQPLLERTFGRIRQGVAPTRGLSPLPDILEERTVEIKIPVPLISIELLAFKGCTEYDQDANALDLAMQVLSNGKAGLLDSLMNEGNLMAAISMPQRLNDAGLNLLLLVPNLLSSSKKAEQACLDQINRLCNGEFSEKTLTLLKQDALRNANKSLETISDRADVMVRAMASGHSWEEYLKKTKAIEHLTKAQVVEAANKYFKTPFVRFKKKMGSYPKDRLSQPDYKPVIPKNKASESAYARRLSEMPVLDIPPRMIDFEKDAVTTTLSPHSTLYTVSNPYNDLFSLTLYYNQGTKANPRLEHTQELLNNIGTDSLSRQQFMSALQSIGADLSFDVSQSIFEISLTGTDSHFDDALRLLGHFMTHAQSNTKALKQMRDTKKASDKSFGEENQDIMKALLNKIRYGENSELLTHLNKKEVYQLTGEDLLQAFRDVFASECIISYSGNLPSESVASSLRAHLPVEQSVNSYHDYYQESLGYDEPLVYVYDMPKSRQTLFFTYEQHPALPTQAARTPLLLFQEYFGGGMSSVMFQEVREFRSMAYSTGARSLLPPRVRHGQSPVSFITIVGTQGDKTMKAITLVDSLLHNMPLSEANFASARQEEINSIYTDFPSFREIGTSIALLRQGGSQQDPNIGWAELYPKATMDEMVSYYERNVKNNDQHRVLAIVGDKRKLDLKALSKYGRIIMVKKQDLYRF